MTLQSSGAISISQIKAELSSSSNSLRDLSADAGFSSPDAMSEFYGYSSPDAMSEFYGYSAVSYVEGWNAITINYMTYNISSIGGGSNNDVSGSSTNYNIDGTTAEASFVLDSLGRNADLDFGWSVSSEACCDDGIIAVQDDLNGYVLIFQGAGENTGTYYPHTVSPYAQVWFYYQKDGSVSAGSDEFMWRVIGYY